MSLFRRLAGLSIAFVTVGVAGAPLDAAPPMTSWRPPVALGPEINSEPAFGAAISRDGLSLFLTRGPSNAADLFVSHRRSRRHPWGVPRSLGAPVNTSSTEMIPSLSRDEHWLFFTSDRPGSGTWDIWAAWRRHTKDDFGWRDPINLGPGVNTDSQETTGSFFANRHGRAPLFFFASNRLIPGLPVPPPGQLPVAHDIYVAELQPDGTFDDPVRDEALSTFNGGVDDMEGRPMVRFDGLEVVFVSNRPGGKGQQDLWVSTRDSVFVPWGTPVNLEAVNTPDVELHPYLSPDGRTLYFSRRTPTGAPQLYVTTRDKRGCR